MTELETRLRDSLSRAARNAPAAAGLAARVRARRRPRPRLATSIGAGLAVAAAVVAIAVLPTLQGGPGGGDPRGDTPTDLRTRDDGWRTVTVVAGRGVGTRLDVDVPPGWTKDRLDVRPAAARRDAEPPGAVAVGIDSWSGYVVTDGVSVAVDVMVTEDAAEATARRVLASVRPEGEPAPDLRGWERERVADEYSELTAVVPDDPRVRVRLSSGIPDCMSSPTGRFPARQQPDGSWRASFCRDRMASVTAPTRALADVVAATVEGY